MATVSLCESCRSDYPDTMEGDDNYSTTRPCDECGYAGRDLTNTFTLPERHAVGDTLTILTQSYYSGGIGWVSVRETVTVVRVMPNTGYIGLVTGTDSPVKGAGIGQHRAFLPSGIVAN